MDQFSNAPCFIIVPYVRNEIYFCLCHYLQQFVMSLRCGHSVLGCCGALWGLCCGSGTEGVCVPGGFHHGLSCWSRCFWACLEALLGGCLGLCPNLACGFCFATGSSFWCHGGLGRSVPLF